MNNLPKLEFRNTNLEFQTPKLIICHFKNLNTEKLAAASKRTGIYATKSSFNVSYDGDKCCGQENGPCPDNCFNDPGMQSRRNVFEKLGIGIKADLSLTARATFISTPSNKFACRNADFIDCIKGIQLENGLDAAIGLNNFAADKSNIDDYFIAGTTTNPNIIGVWLNNCSGNRIYENNFTAIDNNFEYVVVIRSENPNLTQTSFIRSNTFYNPTVVTATYSPENVRAIDLYGNNNYLDITCNTFQNQVFDVRVNAGASLNDLPDMNVHGTNDKFSANAWSILPAALPGITDFEWKTDGISSNIYNETHNMAVFDGYTNKGYDNLRFAIGSFPRIGDVNNFIYYPNSECGTNNACVDCGTNCEKLQIINVAPVTGINQLFTEKNGILIYPNPSKKHFTIVLKEQIVEDGTPLSIFDLQGRLVYTTILKASYTTINTEELNLTDGTYVLELSNSIHKIHQKIIILK